MTQTERDELRRRWESDIGSSGPASARVFDDLLSRWSSPSRRYHNIEHLRDCLDELASSGPVDGVAGRRPVALAIWFHDAIYDATRSDNEAASADLADAALRALGEPRPAVADVCRLILDTAHRAEPVTADGRLIVDIDLAILGKPPERFDRYDAAIRAEYAHVPDADYRAGRSRVLRGFLDRPRIYRIPRFAERYESQARINLTLAIDRCFAGPAAPRMPRR